jgi:hypothetical protein
VALSLTHAFVSPVADAGEAGIVGPDDWNAEHTLTMAGDRVLGRLSSAGAVQELTGANVLTLIGASAILTALLAVDGSGSGLDADLLDGSEASAFYQVGGTDVALADGGTGASLADPGADRLVGWDDTAGAVKFFALTDFNIETHPVAGVYLVGYSAAGAMVRVDFGDFDFQPLDATLTSLGLLGTVADRLAYTTGVDTWAETALTAFARSILDDADEATFKATVNLEANTDFYAPAGTDVALADGGTGASLADPGADRLLGWEETGNAVKFFALTDFNIITHPAAGDYLIAYTSAGAMARVDFGDIEGLAASGLQNVVEDLTPQLGGNLDLNGFVITGLVIGTNVQAWDAQLDTWAGVTPSANGQSLVSAADYAAMVALLEADIEAALDTLANLTSVQGQAISLSAPLTIPADPGADRLFFWDDSAGATAWLTLGNGLTITTTTIAVDAASQTVDGIVELATAAEYRTGTDTGRVPAIDQIWAAPAEVTLTDAATIAVDMSTFINAVVTLAGNRTLGSPTNEKVGQTGYIRIVQDATGSRTLAYGTDWEFAGGTAPVLSTTAADQDVLFYTVLASNRILGALVKDIS